MGKVSLKKLSAIIILSVSIIPLGYFLSISQDVTNNGWVLTWNDEFNDENLDTTKWSYQTGNGYNGWGNNEEQYYTEKNVTVSDGTLKITAKEEAKEGYRYTSGKIRTISNSGNVKFSSKYGKFEARIKMPKGQGLWPAFWMMPVSNEYGQWPLSGEIDIMEARGRIPDKINCSIHFGELYPNNKNMGSTYTFLDGTDITDFHIYSVEWNENTIIWYVDGHEYFRTGNWYTINDTELAEYPAPFNKEFYLRLNLAIGGNYDDYQTPISQDLPAVMEVDYVRVYQQQEGYTNGVLGMPDECRDTKAVDNITIYEDGNLLNDINFLTVNESPIYNTDAEFDSNKWFLIKSKYFGGDASLSKSVIDNKTYVNVNIKEAGYQSFSIQLKQLLPLAKGYVYKITFDAMTDRDERTIKVKPVGSFARAYINYDNSYVAYLTNNMQTYETSFIMKAPTDLGATLEFNLGQNNGDVIIGNVKVKIMDTYKFNKLSFNLLENGDFSKGISNWNVYGTYYAIETIEGNNCGKIYTVPKKYASDRMWMYEGIKLLKGEDYVLSFKAKSSEENQKFGVNLENDKFAKTLSSEFFVGTQWTNISYEFKADTDEQLTLKYLLGSVSTPCKLYLDDVELKVNK